MNGVVVVLFGSRTMEHDDVLIPHHVIEPLGNVFPIWEVFICFNAKSALLTFTCQRFQNLKSSLTKEANQYALTIMVNAERRNLLSFLNLGLILFSLVFIQHQMGLHQ